MVFRLTKKKQSSDKNIGNIQNEKMNFSLVMPKQSVKESVELTKCYYFPDNDTK